MTEKDLNIGDGIKLVVTEYDYDGAIPEVTLEYIERQADHYYGDMETSVDISPEKACKIVNFLIEAFDIEFTFKKKG